MRRPQPNDARRLTGELGSSKKDHMNVQSTVFDLDTMEKVTLVKPVPTFVPVTSTADALARLGNDAARFLKVINEGLESEIKESIKADINIPWMVEEESEDGKTVELTPFSGMPADETKVNGLILSFAKNMFGYQKKMDADAEKSRAAIAASKQQAIDMIRTTPAIVERLKLTARA